MKSNIDRVFLKIEGYEFTVLSYDFKISQLFSNNKPTSHPKSDVFTLNVVNVSGSPILMEWSINTAQTRDVNIDYFSNGCLVSNLDLTDAFCVSYNQKVSYDPLIGTCTVIEEVSIISSQFAWRNGTQNVFFNYKKQ